MKQVLADGKSGKVEAVNVEQSLDTTLELAGYHLLVKSIHIVRDYAGVPSNSQAEVPLALRGPERWTHDRTTRTNRIWSGGSRWYRSPRQLPRRHGPRPLP